METDKGGKLNLTHEGINFKLKTGIYQQQTPNHDTEEKVV